MALSANAQYDVRKVVEVAPLAYVVKTSAVVYNGALCSHDTVTGAIEPFDGTQTNRLVGWHFGDAVTGATTTTPAPRAKITRGGFSIKDLAVTGLDNTAADYGKPVYATADGTYTVTDPGSGQKIGVIVADDDRASGYAHVYFLLIGLGA